MPLLVLIVSATPYAGITQVRFEGYTLSLYGTPRIHYSVVVHTLLHGYVGIKQIFGAAPENRLNSPAFMVKNF